MEQKWGRQEHPPKSQAHSSLSKDRTWCNRKAMDSLEVLISYWTSNALTVGGGINIERRQIQRNLFNIDQMMKTVGVTWVLDIHTCVFWRDNLFTFAPNDMVHMLNGELRPNLWSEHRHEVTRHDVTSLEHQTRNMSQAIFSSFGLYLCLTHQHTQEETLPSQFVQQDSTHPEKKKKKPSLRTS